MNRIYIDFETHSAADIKKVGAYLYANHPSTDVLCVAFAVGKHRTDLITQIPCHREPELNHVRTLWYAITNPRTVFVAHNAAFEQFVWEAIMVKKYDFPPIPIERWRCTMAKAYSHGLPGNLEGCAKALKLTKEKDMEGSRVMKMLATPKTKRDLGDKYDPDRPVFWTPEERPEDFEKLYRYCAQDVEVEREIDLRLPDLDEKEQRIWFIDQRMNQEGIQLDTPTIHLAMALNDEHQERIREQTDLGFDPKQRAKLLEWLQSQGLSIQDTRKGTLDKLRKDPTLPADLKAALHFVGEATKTSLAKMPQMLARSDDQGVLRETLAYHAAHTGRWGGRGVQIQNLMRPAYDMDNVVAAINLASYECFSYVYPNVSHALASSMRGMLVARPGKKFLVADLSQMEARVLAWLAGQQEVLDTFERGEDLYCVAASDIYGRTITPKDKAERQVGKVAVLALGYQGGIGAFAKMADAYGVDLLPAYPALIASASPAEIRECERDYLLYLKRTKGEDAVSKEIGFLSSIIKQRFRVANDKIQEYWGIAEDAAIRAVVTGKPVTDIRCTWFMHGIFLYAKLPDGKVIAYPYPKIEETKTGKQTLSSYATVLGKWMRIGTYGGRLVENLTQAVQAQILKDAILNLEKHGYNVLFHVHDEIIAEVESDDDSLEKYCGIMAEVPIWAEGLPVGAKGWEGYRYGKE